MATDKILRQIYYSEDGFDSKAVTLKKARLIQPDIIKQDVDAWFEKQESQQLNDNLFIIAMWQITSCNRYTPISLILDKVVRILNSSMRV